MSECVFSPFFFVKYLTCLMSKNSFNVYIIRHEKLTFSVLRLTFIPLYIFVVYVLFHLNVDVNFHNTHNKMMMYKSDNRKWLDVIYQFLHPNLIVHVLYYPNFSEFLFHIKYIVMNYIVHNKMLLYITFYHHMINVLYKLNRVYCQ